MAEDLALKRSFSRAERRFVEFSKSEVLVFIGVLVFGFQSRTFVKFLNCLGGKADFYQTTNEAKIGTKASWIS